MKLLTIAEIMKLTWELIQNQRKFVWITVLTFVIEYILFSTEYHVYDKEVAVLLGPYYVLLIVTIFSFWIKKGRCFQSYRFDYLIIKMIIGKFRVIFFLFSDSTVKYFPLHCKREGHQIKRLFISAKAVLKIKNANLVRNGQKRTSPRWVIVPGCCWCLS